MRAVTVIGYKKSGKTGLSLALLGELKKLGLSVAVAKHSHHSFAEKQGADTSRFRTLGCPVLVWSPNGSQVFWPEDGVRRTCSLWLRPTC